jgi:hypothetical protein
LPGKNKNRYHQIPYLSRQHPQQPRRQTGIKCAARASPVP